MKTWPINSHTEFIYQCVKDQYSLRNKLKLRSNYQSNYKIYSHLDAGHWKHTHTRSRVYFHSLETHLSVSKKIQKFKSTGTNGMAEKTTVDKNINRYLLDRKLLKKWWFKQNRKGWILWAYRGNLIKNKPVFLQNSGKVQELEAWGLQKVKACSQGWIESQYSYLLRCIHHHHLPPPRQVVYFLQNRLQDQHPRYRKQ